MRRRLIFNERSALVCVAFATLVALGGCENTTELADVRVSPLEGSTAGVIARLQAGELTREQAVDALVAQALELHGGSRLPAPQRAELSSLLRDALLHDPALARLLG